MATQPSSSVLARVTAARLDIPPLAELHSLVVELKQRKDGLTDIKASIERGAAHARQRLASVQRESNVPSPATSVGAAPPAPPPRTADADALLLAADDDVKPDLAAIAIRVKREGSTHTCTLSAANNGDAAADDGWPGTSRHTSPDAGVKPSLVAGVKRKHEDLGDTPMSPPPPLFPDHEPDSPDVPLSVPNRLPITPTKLANGSPKPVLNSDTRLLVPTGSATSKATPPSLGRAATSPIPVSALIPPRFATSKSQTSLGVELPVPASRSRPGSINSFTAANTPTPVPSQGQESRDGQDKEPSAPTPPKPRLRYGLTPSQGLALPTPTSLPASQPSLVIHKSKSHSGPGYADDFSFPTRVLVPPAPISKPPPSHPKVQSEVDGDFSKAKPPNAQVSIHTFQQWVNEHFLRPYGEDDLAFLAPGVEDPVLMRLPPVGRHYSDVWKEEDATTGGDSEASGSVPPLGVNPSSALDYAPLRRVRRDEVTDTTIQSERIEVGPVTERLVSSLQPPQLPTHHGEAGIDLRPRKRKKDKGKGRLVDGVGTDEPGWVAGGPGQAPMQLDTVELESRVKKELRYLGLLPEDEVDWSTRQDDEISSALRATQRAYRCQRSMNEARKCELASRVKDRMAFQEYEHLREGLDRAIEQGWVKRYRQETRKKQNKQKNHHQSNSITSMNGIPTSTSTPNGGLNRIPLSETLISSLEKRQKFIEGVGSIFENAERGRYRGIPTSSIYSHLLLESTVEPTPQPPQLLAEPNSSPVIVNHTKQRHLIMNGTSRNNVVVQETLSKNGIGSSSNTPIVVPVTTTTTNTCSSRGR